jgi:hypothetical protein
VGVIVAVCVMVGLADIAVAHASSDAVLVLHFDEGLESAMKKPEDDLIFNHS